MQLLGTLTAVQVATVLDIPLPVSVNQIVKSLVTAVMTFKPSAVSILKYSNKSYSWSIIIIMPRSIVKIDVQ